MWRDNSEKLITSLLSTADVIVDGSRAWDIQVHDPRFYARVVRDGALGLGESYMDGWWDCAAVDQLIDRVLRARLDKKVKGDVRTLWLALKSRLVNMQSRGRAFQVGEQHYDAGNDLYCAMLDSRLNYTCGYWANASTLDEAQEAKLELVCRKLGLQRGMTVLDLGCGFGSFAGYAAQKYGVAVTGVTVSKCQVELGMQRYKGLPVDLRLMDYREVTGSYDRVISIGIMEHVGYKNYRTYMDVVDRTLKPDGIAFIHTIGGNASVTTANGWTVKYIFPNGMLPSVAQLGSAMEGRFVMEDWHNFGPDYDKTLMAWHERFERAWPALRQKYSERFRRMWRYYLLTSAGGFRSRQTQLWHIVLTRVGREQPVCRMS